jgi:predicted transcriptional regulator of viral defense system
MSKVRKARKYERRGPLLAQLAKLPSFTLAEANEAGLSHPEVLRLLEEKKVTRLQRGIYSVAGNEPVGEEGDYALADRKLEGRGVIGGLTALSHYSLLDESPSQIWVLVPPEVRTTDKKYRLLRTSRDLTEGVQDKGQYRISTLERALIDALVYATKIGEQVGQLAILRALRRKLTTPEKIFSMANKMDKLPVLEKVWPSILAGLAQ